MKLVKVAVVVITVIRHMVLVVEKVVAKERVQMLVVVLNMDLVLVVLKDQRFVKQAEFHFH